MEIGGARQEGRPLPQEALFLAGPMTPGNYESKKEKITSTTIQPQQRKEEP
jgi:hypothetical protein